MNTESVTTENDAVFAGTKSRCDKKRFMQWNNVRFVIFWILLLSLTWHSGIFCHLKHSIQVMICTGREFMDAATCALKEIDGGRILDVATGRGGFAAFLMETLGGWDELVGIDSSPRAEGHFTTNIKDEKARFVQMDAENMEFDDASFDTVAISNSLHHLTDPETVLNEMLRVLKPGGTFIVNEMHRDTTTAPQTTHLLLHTFWAEVDTELGIVHDAVLSRDDFAALMDGLSLSDTVVHEIVNDEGDPKDPDLLKELDGVLDAYHKRLDNNPRQEEFRIKGEELRHRVHEVGYQSCPTLLAIGRKK